MQGFPTAGPRTGAVPRKFFAGPQNIFFLHIIGIIIILLQECASFYFWNPAEGPRMQGSAGFCSLVAIFHDLEHPTFANLW